MPDRSLRQSAAKTRKPAKPSAAKPRKKQDKKMTMPLLRTRSGVRQYPKRRSGKSKKRQAVKGWIGTKWASNVRHLLRRKVAGVYKVHISFVRTQRREGIQFDVLSFAKLSEEL